MVLTAPIKIKNGDSNVRNPRFQILIIFIFLRYPISLKYPRRKEFNLFTVKVDRHKIYVNWALIQISAIEKTVKRR